MKIIKAGYGLIEEESVTKKIERIARVCYKSEGLISEGSDIRMLNKLAERKHYAMLEHASLVYVVPEEVYWLVKSIYDECKTKFKECTVADAFISNLRMNFTETLIPEEKTSYTSTRYIISANLRGWLEFFEYCDNYCKFSIPMNAAYLKGLIVDIWRRTSGIVDFTEFVEDIEDSLAVDVKPVTTFEKLSTPERMVHETFSVLFTVDRGVTHELVRMRDCSFAQESTRYCNYSADKYGDEITVIKPIFFEEGTKIYENWSVACAFAEAQYIYMTKDLEVPAQQARDVLPTSVKADIVITTNLQEWRHIFELRACDATGPAHPQMKEVMCPLCLDMQEKYAFAFGDLEVKSL